MFRHGLATLLVQSGGYDDTRHGSVPRIHGHIRTALAGLDQVRRLADVANMILLFLDWAIRKNRPSEIDFWLDHADWLFGES